MAYDESTFPTSKWNGLSSTITYALNNGVTMGYSVVADDTASERTNERTFLEIFKQYEVYGIEYTSDTKNGGLGNVYCMGILIKKFVDINPDGGVFSFASSDGGTVSLYVNYDENGKLSGITLSVDND